MKFTARALFMCLAYPTQVLMPEDTFNLHLLSVGRQPTGTDKESYRLPVTPQEAFNSM